MEKLIGPQYFENFGFTSVKQLFERACDTFSEYTAIVYRNLPSDDPIEKTYRQVGKDVYKVNQMFAKFAKQHDIPFEDLKVSIQGENSYGWILSYLAPLMSTATVVPLDRLLEGTETTNLLNRSRAQIYVGDAKNFLALVPHLDELPHLKIIYLLNEHKLNKKQKQELTEVKRTIDFPLFDYWDEVEKSSQTAPVRVDEPDPHAAQILLFTSGTTSQSKGVLLSQFNLASNVNQLMGSVTFDAGFRLLSILPLNHSFENTCGLLTAMSFGGRIHICDGLRYISKNLKEYQADMIIAVPAIMEAIWRRIEQTIKRQGKEKKFRRAIKISRFLRKIGIDLRHKFFKEIQENLGGLSVVIVGAAPMAKELIELFDEIGIRLLQGYGLTEGSPVVIGCNSVVFVPGTVGVPLAGIEIAIDNEEPGEPGEILVRGDNVTEHGYYEDPVQTRKLLPGDGWMHTGDLGVIDPETGCVKITGRIKSMIVLDNGKKVFPEEVEFLLNERSDHLIRQALVFGGEDERGEVMVSAKFVVDSDQTKNPNTLEETLATIVDEVNDLLPSFMRIKTWFYSFKDMVSTTTMKIRRSAEEANIQSFLKENDLRLKNINRMNIDELKFAEQVTPGSKTSEDIEYNSEDKDEEKSR